MISAGSLGFVRHAVFELDGEMAQGAWPVGDSHGPFGTEVFQAEVEQLEQRVDGGKQVAVAADLAKRAVERFDGVGGVDDSPDLRGEVEEGRELVPVRLPAAADGGWRASWVARKAVSAARAACSVGAL